ncbi:MAG TPA: thioredoxin domain-containing protein [Thermoanaerobaculia bacterium]|nr:thioredoxin domain-containing protein [Thermoanaerobaculia bacterium]
MRPGIRRIFPLVALVGAMFVLGSASWALDKKGPKISVGDDPSMKQGSPKLVLVEVADFQCHYCGIAAREVLPKIDEKFVSTGKVELIFLDLPLQMHPHAFKAAEAAACAGEQQMFWDMYAQLFGHQGALAPDKLSGYAEEIGLDIPAFQKCLSSGKHAGAIKEDMRTANNLGITGTPAFLLGSRLPGSDKVQVFEIVKGAVPYEDLEKKINALLSPAQP